MKQFLLLLLFLHASQFDFGGAKQGEPAYMEKYRRAEELYAAENPTGQSDSLALSLYLQVINTLKADRSHDSLLIHSCTRAATLHQMKGQDSVAIHLFTQALEIKKSNGRLSDSLIYLPLLYCGSSYYTLQQFDSARYYFLQAENVIERFPHLPERERLYNKIGTLYYEEGNYHQSLNYFSKALSLLDTTREENNFLLVNYYNNIAITYKKMGRYQQALNAYTSLLKYQINRDELLHNIATVYLDLNRPREALHYLHAGKKPGQQHYNNLALAHLKAGQPDSADIYLQKAFDNRTRGFKTTVNGLTWYYLGRLQETRGQLTQALKTYHRAIIELDPDFSDTSVNSNPTQFKGMHSFTDLFNALAAKARIQRALFTNDRGPEWLKRSLQTWETTLLLAKTVQQGYEADASRLFLNNNLQPASEEAASTALQLYQVQPGTKALEKIFQLAETSKAAVLQIKMQQTSIASLPGMPVDLLNQQKTQQILLARLQVQYESTADSSYRSSLQQQIRDQEINLSEINQQLNDHPAYAEALSITKELDIAALQRALPEHMAMLSYYFIRDKWLAFVLRKDSLHLKILPADPNTDALLESMRKQLSSAALSAEQLKAPAANLHHWLIEPLTPYLGGIMRLMIIPDHDLQYLPFEILVSQAGKKMLDEFAISYNYSAVFYTGNEKQPGRALKELGLAPFGGNRKTYASFTQLPASAEEIRLIDGKKLIDSAATKQAFMQEAANYGTIHLATHAAANDREPQNSFIAFYPAGTDTNYKLYQPEIYNLDLHHTQLVILSACETGTGQFVHGEGMMSLARAFSYAGCRSVITSLWKADDASTAYITKRLHHYLESGKPKDVALQKAKLDYLEDSEVPQRFKTPAHWSHLVLIGDATSLHASSNTWSIIIAIAIAGIIIVAIALKKRAAKKPVRRAQAWFP